MAPPPQPHPRRRRRPPPPPPPPLPDDVVEEILFRLPHDDPACLLRASLVCKPWRRLVSDPGFLRRLHAHGRAPRMLGFLHDTNDERAPVYVPTSAFSFPVPDPRFWTVLGCRHGRAVFRSFSKGSRNLLVWEPITGDRWTVPVPAELKIQYWNATVMCAADGCDHRDCHGGPFRVVLVYCDPDDEEEGRHTSACVYSSETGAWSGRTSVGGGSLICSNPSVLVRNSLLYFLSDDGYILEYDLARHGLAVFNPPDLDAALMQQVIIMPAEDGGLGVAEAEEWRLYLWSREVSDGGDARWVQRRLIYVDDLLPAAAYCSPQYGAILMGFAEGANTIFVSTDAGLYAVELQSKRARKVCEDRCNFYPLVPIVSSCIFRDTLQAPLSPNSSEEGEEEDEKTVEERAQELFDKGSEAIKEGNFVDAVDYLRRALEFRVAYYGEFAPECASTYYKYGCALLYKAQEVTDLLDNVPKSAPDEKSVKSATSKADTGKVSGRNVEGAPSSEKGDTEEGQNSKGKEQVDGDGDNDMDDDEMAADEDDSYLDLAWKMLSTARVIVEKCPDKKWENVEIFSALDDVYMEKRYLRSRKSTC